MYGGDYDYAASRLCGSVVLVAGKPIMVEAISGTGRVGYNDLKTGDYGECRFDNLDLTPLEVGYVNIPNHNCVYVCRKPMRRDWRQGLRYQNMTVLGSELRSRDIPYKFIAKSIINDFPKFEDVLQLLKVGDLDRRVAWCRQFAVTPNSMVYYCGDSVGHVNRKTGEVVLDEDFTYLNEALEETL